ncbi:MAG TPA: hypothetical protein VIK53_01250 [Verrucomicrobiae bacterium]
MLTTMRIKNLALVSHGVKMIGNKTAGTTRVVAPAAVFGPGTAGQSGRSRKITLP